MKTSIGEIVDRYSICKLKSERLQLDLSQEINELTSEMNLYNGLDEYINELYKVNGNIWDLESDIRKCNEAILGLEEIGRRALKIRDFNNIRVSIKNKINSDPRSHHFRPGAYQQECRQRFTPRRFRTEGHTNDYYCADLLNTGSYSAY